MNVFPTALIRYKVHSTSFALEIWVRWNEKIDGSDEDLGAWIDPHGALIVQTNIDPACARQIFLPDAAWTDLNTNPFAQLVLCGVDNVITTREFQLGVIIL